MSENLGGIVLTHKSHCSFAVKKFAVLIVLRRAGPTFFTINQATSSLVAVDQQLKFLI